MFSRGARVIVTGYLGKTAVLRVWHVGPKGVWCCTEDGFRRRLLGEEAPVVGYPVRDVTGLAPGSAA